MTSKWQSWLGLNSLHIDFLEWSPLETLGSIMLLFEGWGGESRGLVPGTTQYKFRWYLTGYLNRGYSKPSATPQSVVPSVSYQTSHSCSLPWACRTWTKKKKGHARSSWKGYGLSWLVTLENSMCMSHSNFEFLTPTCFHQEYNAWTNIKIDRQIQTALACLLQLRTCFLCQKFYRVVAWSKNVKLVQGEKVASASKNIF